jgi:hypothetical protein
MDKIAFAFTNPVQLKHYDHDAHACGQHRYQVLYTLLWKRIKDSEHKYLLDFQEQSMGN